MTRAGTGPLAAAGPRGRAAAHAALALARSCHPLPAGAVTSITALLAASAGLAGPRLALLVAAVLCGQASIGWLNDLLDRYRDRAARRTDKPLARGDIAARTVAAAAGGAALACVVASLALGLGPGLVHLAAVAGGWAYDLGLKRTAWSPLPYAVSFSLLPIAVWLAVPGGPPAPWWLVLAAALLGVGAHAANVLPDRDADLAGGVRGLPHRLPPAASRVAAVVLPALAVAVLAAGPPGPAGPLGWGALSAAAALVAAAAVRAPAAGHRAPFFAAVGAAAVGVGMLAARALLS